MPIFLFCCGLNLRESLWNVASRRSTLFSVRGTDTCACTISIWWKSWLEDRATDLVFVKPAHEYEISDHIFFLWSPLVPQQGSAEHRVLMTLLYEAMIDQVLFFCKKLARRLLSQQEGSQGDEWYGEHAEPYWFNMICSRFPTALTFITLSTVSEVKWSFLSF